MLNDAIEKCESGSNGGSYALIKLTAIRKLDGKASEEAFISENHQFDEIRKAAEEIVLSGNIDYYKKLKAIHYGLGS